MPQHADLGLIGLAVMGRNLALNIADHGYSVAVYNRSAERTDGFLAGEATDAPIVGVGDPLRQSESLEPVDSPGRGARIDPHRVGEVAHPPAGPVAGKNFEPVELCLFERRAIGPE